MKRAFVSQLHSKFVLSQISSVHKSACINMGICSEVAKALSQMINITVDAPKTGAEIDNNEINELIAMVDEGKRAQPSILALLADFFRTEIPLLMQNLNAELMSIVTTLHYNAEFLTAPPQEHLLALAVGLRKAFNDDINFYLNHFVPKRIIRDTNPYQVIVGSVFRTNSMDRLEWDKEEKDIRQTLTDIMNTHRRRVANEARQRGIDLRRLIEACYRVTYDLSTYSSEDFMFVYGVGEPVVCLLFPWAIRPPQNIFFAHGKNFFLLPNSQIKNLIFTNHGSFS